MSEDVLDEELAKEFRQEVSCESLMDAYEEAKIIYDQLSEQKTAAEKKKDALEIALVEAMQKAGQKTVKRMSGVSFTVTKRVYYRTGAEDRGKQRQYLIGRGLEDMLTVNHNTWGAFCREMVEGGDPLPEFVKQTEEFGLTVRGLK
jgi:hypothetical protein